MNDKWEIQPHNEFDKSFVIDGPLPLIIDNDDVWGPGVELLAKHVVQLLNKHWITVHHPQCVNHDCEYYLHFFSTMNCPHCDKPTMVSKVYAS